MLIILCDGCGRVLLETRKLRSPLEVIEKMGNCRYCGKKLVYDVNKIEIK